MEPRLKTSRKWTELPKELIQQIRSVFSGAFKDHVGTAKIEADGRIYPEEILIRVGLARPNQLKQAGFLVSIAYKKEKDNVLKLLHLGMDAMGALFEQYFAADDDHEFPRTWQEVNFEGRPIFVQYSTTNTELEAEADKLLGTAGSDQLAQGDWDDGETTADDIKLSLGIDPDNLGEDDDVPEGAGDDDDGEGSVH